MKAINEFRSTNKFCVLANVARDLGRIYEWAGRDLVAVGNEDETSVYTVRKSYFDEAGGYWCKDEKIEVEWDGSIKVLEERVVTSPELAARIKAILGS